MRVWGPRFLGSEIVGAGCLGNLGPALAPYPPSLCLFQVPPCALGPLLASSWAPYLAWRSWQHFSTCVSAACAALGVSEGPPTPGGSLERGPLETWLNQSELPQVIHPASTSLSANQSKAPPLSLEQPITCFCFSSSPFQDTLLRKRSIPPP